MSDMVGNPEVRFSRVAAHTLYMCICKIFYVTRPKIQSNANQSFKKLLTPN